MTSGAGAGRAFATRTHPILRALDHTIPLGDRTVVMGVLNCTPDSFSDGGLYLDPDAAARRIEQIAGEGADWIDIGGESTRPGAEPVDAEEEWRRVAPAFAEARRSGLKQLLSIDTTKAEVARRALDQGAAVLNDVSGLRFDPRLASLAAESGAALILMHMRGEPRTMQADPAYADVTSEILVLLREAAEEARARGVAEDRLVIDPGLGFGKTAEHNLELLRRLPELTALGLPVLVGASRKSFLGKILDLATEERLEGSLAAHTAAVLAGAHIVRAHDVRATVRAVRTADALLSGIR